MVGWRGLLTANRRPLLRRCESLYGSAADRGEGAPAIGRDSSVGRQITIAYLAVSVRYEEFPRRQFRCSWQRFWRRTLPPPRRSHRSSIGILRRIIRPTISLNDKDCTAKSASTCSSRAARDRALRHSASALATSSSVWPRWRRPSCQKQRGKPDRRHGRLRQFTAWLLLVEELWHRWTEGLCRPQDRRPAGRRGARHVARFRQSNRHRSCVSHLCQYRCDQDAGTQSHAVDIISDFYSEHDLKVAEFGTDLRILPWTSLGINPSGDSIAVNGEYLESHKDVVKAFINMTQRAFAACVKDEEPCLQTLLVDDSLMSAGLTSPTNAISGDASRS
jgi:hypothetical protein